MTTVYINDTLSSSDGGGGAEAAGSPQASTTPTATSSPIGHFFNKYFRQGQHLSGDIGEGSHSLQAKKCLLDDSHPTPLPFHRRHRKWIGFLIPFTFMHLMWWSLAIRYSLFRLYPTRWELPLTMVLGATVAGATSEGGGAIAFPVMTLLLQINPKVARDFSLMIQSAGMTSAAFTILWMQVQVEWNSIILGSIGSTIGIIFGLTFTDDLLTSSEKKMLFVSIWFSFALSLFILNTQRKRVTYSQIKDFCAWKGAVLVLTGVVGGLCSAFAGSGVDICSFSILTLLFRVSEKVATPTSVVLMAINTCVGFFWRQLIMNGISQLAWEYFSVSMPVVVFCAPMGSLLASHFHRLTLACFVYVLEVAALVGFLLTRPSWNLITMGGGIVCVSFAFFFLLSHLGKRLNRDGLQLEESTSGGGNNKREMISCAG